MTDKPFVLSEDAEVLLRRWAEQKGFRLPSSAFFAGLLDTLVGMLRKIFGNVILAEELAIAGQLNTWVRRDGLPAVSMDGVYFCSPFTIQVNRMVDGAGNDAGLGSRPGTLPLQDQLESLRNNGLTEIVLVDDVVYSGHQMAQIIGQLKKVGIRVVRVLAGISIGMGESLLSGMGVDIAAVYSIPEVVDEICQRDFLPGVPRSGRTLAGSGNVGMPYILPFGNPGKWASIPEGQQQKFSRECIELAIRLFEGIEEMSGRLVLCSDLSRPVFSLPQNDVRFVDCLHQLL